MTRNTLCTATLAAAVLALFHAGDVAAQVDAPPSATLTRPDDATVPEEAPAPVPPPDEDAAPVPPPSEDASRRVAPRATAAPTPPAAPARVRKGERCPDDDVCYDLHIKYVEGKIRNPNFGEDTPQGHDNVRLRGYAGAVEARSPDAGEVAEFIAPMVELKPGSTFRLTLHNELPKPEDMDLPGVDTPCPATPPAHNLAHCANFNLTNMHTHGLWVSPSGNSDNVLMTINPGVSFTYEYNIPSDHPAGTFWYHSHRHGSTGPQVASGMAGALIIRGDRQPVLADGVWTRPGDIDVILPRPAAGTDVQRGVRFPERVLLLQQIAYACRNPDGTIKQDPADNSWLCDAAAGDVGTVEPGPADAFDQLAFNAWPQSRRHTAINGVVHKTFAPATVGGVERWRLIHAGVRQTINLHIRKATSPQAVRTLLEKAEPQARKALASEIATVCSGEPLTTAGMAADGLTRPTLDPRQETWLQPGYREDILVTFPEAGTYCVLNAPVAGANDINALENEPSILGFVEVKPASVKLDADPVAHIRKALVAAAGANIRDARVRQRVVNELLQGRLSAFTKHQPVADGEVTGVQTLGFDFAPPRFHIGELNLEAQGGPAVVNPAAYDPGTINRTLPLGEAQEWHLASFGPAGHPYHIHVNPFEIVAILKYRDANDPSINPEDPSTWVDVTARTPGNTSQYAGLKGTWKDTLFVLPDHVIKVRSRYERYIGDFVLHCHILDHEDLGMMQNIRIAVPDGRGGFDIPMTEHTDH